MRRYDVCPRFEIRKTLSIRRHDVFEMRKALLKASHLAREFRELMPRRYY